ncbi:MAG: DUF4115 domain-containing protein [Patescibacteria group bacterium]|nr:DUF4115 domain-containing protein [Patescibacteria group bacterium]
MRYSIGESILQNTNTMIGFTRKKVNSHTLGERLRKIREEANISLNEISKATKVRKVYLEMLEEERFDELPPDVYVRGFLNSYAGYLGIEPEDVFRLYEKEKGIQKNIKKSKRPIKREKKFQIPSITITSKFFVISAFVILIVAMSIYFYREVGKFSENPRLAIVQPLNNISIDGNAVEIVGVSEKDARVTINGQPIYIDEHGEFKETIGLKQGVNELEIKAVNRFDKEAIKKINISANFDTSIAINEDEEKVMGAQDQQDNGIIKFGIQIEQVPTWISIEVDGNIIQSGTMLPGSAQIFEGQERISVTSGKADKTIITLNGKVLGPLGDTPGVIRDVIFTKKTEIIPESSVAEQDISELTESEDKKD